MPKGFTVRLDDDQAEELEAVAKVDGVPVAEENRQAIAVRIEQRRNDEQFRARLRQSIEDNQTVLDRLAEDVLHAGRLELAESALQAPAATLGGVKFYADLARTTAGLASRLFNDRPLPNGNKRIGLWVR